MADKVLDDILNNFLPIDCLLNWLSNKNSENEEEIFSRKYECSQIEFVSFFLNFIREQSSRDFQVYDSETPRKTSHLRLIKSINNSANKSSPEISHNSSLNASHLDLESLHLFPTLSSCSSKTDCSESKLLESTPINLTEGCTSKELSDKKSRRVKLFSETVEGVYKGNKKDIEFLDDVDLRHLSEKRFAVSTPKTKGNSPLAVDDYFNSSDLQVDNSPKLGSKSKFKNHSFTDSVTPETTSLAPKSKSFSGELTHKTRDHKMHCKMSLGDFFFNDMNSNENKKDKKNKTRKKINPTKVSNQLQISKNFLDDKPKDFLDNNSHVTELKHFLKMNSEKQIDNKLTKQSIDASEESTIKKQKLLKNSSVEQQQVDMDLVTSVRELKILSQIYSFLINENYCQNIMIELCFIISLLVIQDYNKKTLGLEPELKDQSIIQGKPFFGSIHNCVYFAVETLSLQRNLLILLNLSALKSLSENIRIEKFNLQLKEFLVNAYCQRQLKEEIKRHNGLIKTGMQGNVSFQYETDNRENFTSDASFHSFRKQRDLFYNILAVWQANHLVSGWIFSIGLGSKIRSLLSISSDPINLLHLARLFRNQLVMSCCAESQPEEEFNEEIFQLLPSADPNKILRLRARLTSSSKRQGPCPVPDFTGHQEFYKDFILCTNHSAFHEHLKNSLCDEILRLNETELTGDIEEEDFCLDEQTQDRYHQCTNILRLLAKFLGFVEFLPYRCEKPFSDRIFNIHCSVRNNTLPLFDVNSCLKLAFRRQKLTLTIPWMVSYLSMIDPYSAQLKSYQSVWRSLIMIYKHLTTFKSSKNSFYLKLTLGWIFQLPNFPSDQFYAILDEYKKKSTEFSIISVENQTKFGLDSCDFIEEAVLYSVCPYLNEINVILSENIGCSVKHIRPITTQENSFTKSQASKQLELRLESNFLHNQSSSTRKTVEFVTERVASIAIKHLIHKIIPNTKGAFRRSCDNLLTNNGKETKLEAEALAEACYKKLVNACEEENWKISSKRSEMALKALLSNDLEGAIADTCVMIVTRQATERVQRWMQSHVTLAMLKKEFVSLAKKKNLKKSSDPNSTNNSTLESSEGFAMKTEADADGHRLTSKGKGATIKKRENLEVSPASQSIKSVRDLIWKVCDGSCLAEELEDVMEETVKTITCRNDVIPAAEKALFFLLVDLIVILCVYSVKNVQLEIFQKFIRITKVLKPHIVSSGALERVICPRNVAMVFKAAKNPEKAWESLGKFLFALLEEKLLTREQVETQLLSLLKLNWGKKEGMEVIKFISNIHGEYSKKHGCDKFSLLLEYMIDAIKEDEPKSEYFD